MKKLYRLSFLIISFCTFAQVPQGISYQAIALNGSGSPVVSSNVRVRLSLLDNTATGTVLFSETHLKTTNPQGLFNLTIGQGTTVSGVFATINWGTNAKFLKVEMDATGGTTFVLVGTTQLLTVPYAMYAASVGSIAGNANINDEIVENKSTNFAFVDSSDYKVYAYSIALASWSSQAFNQFASPALVVSNGNFAFNDSSDNKIYVFNGKTGIWSSQPYNQFASPSISQSNGNFSFNDSSDNKIYTYTAKTGAWTSQSYNQFASPSTIVSNNNIAFNDSSDNKVYVYNAQTGVWSSQAYNQFASPTITGSNGNFAFNDSSDNKIYIFNGKNGTWTSQAYNQFASPSITPSPTN
jgi:hypothetical protein